MNFLIDLDESCVSGCAHDAKALRLHDLLRRILHAVANGDNQSLTLFPEGAGL